MMMAVAGIAGLLGPLSAVPSIADEAQTNRPADIQSLSFDRLSHAAVPGRVGVSATFLVGRFDQPGLYAAHGKMEKGAVFPPHRHPDQRLTIVTSGTMYLGQGTVVDDAALIAYPVGTMAITPAGTPHYMVAKDGPVTMLEIGSGPSGMTFYEGD